MTVSDVFIGGTLLIAVVETSLSPRSLSLLRGDAVVEWLFLDRSGGQLLQPSGRRRETPQNVCRTVCV